MLGLGRPKDPNRTLSPAMRRRIADAQRKRWERVRTQQAIGSADKPERIPQSAGSPLLEKMVAHLGRQLNKNEARFVRQLQGCFAAVNGRRLTESELSRIAGRGGIYGNWNGLDLWHHFPANDFYFWLYVAWELRRRNWDYPQFMAGITDFDLIAPEMKQWERERAIQEWNARFGRFEDGLEVYEPGALDLRLAIGAERAYLEWRGQPEAGFAELKPAQANTIAAQFERGALVMASDSVALWSAAYRPWLQGVWWSFPYTDPIAHPRLGRLLRMPLTPDRVVTVNGQPLARVAEPLRLILRPPEEGDDHYELALVTSEGPPPKILCTFQGQPTLYLTEGALFSGPPADALETEISRRVPRAALETSSGLRFLHAAGVSLPQNLSRRIRTVPVQVTISCSLREAFYHSHKEDIALHIFAKAPGMNAERFTPGGWEQDWEERSRKKTDRSNGLVIIHDVAAQRYFPRVIDSLDLKWQDSFRLWTWRVTKNTPEQFIAWLQSLPAEIEVLLDRELATLRNPPMRSEISLDVVEAGIDWFDLKVALKVNDTTLTPDELKLLLNARGGYVRLGTRGWRRLEFNLTPEDEEQLARLGLDARDFTSEPQRLHALQLTDAAARRFLPPDHAAAFERRTNELKVRVTPPLSSDIHAEMRPYQTEGFHFLAYLASNRFGGVLADDMGLGKTLQTLAWLGWLREGTRDSRSPIPSLVVCPKSVMENWRAEAEKFYPSLRVRLWQGDVAAELTAARDHSDLIVINYTQLRYLSHQIARVPWLAAILDEAQYIKNPNSQTAQAARSLQAEYRLALTGTPIENRLLDLWSIFSFAMPGMLGHRAQFIRRFEGKDDSLARRRLAARVRPFLLRRTKGQVERDLPDRVEEDLLCEMEGEQKTLYSAALKRARQLVLGLKTPEELNQQRFNILTSLLRLRQICCHPQLVDASLRGAESGKMSALEDIIEPLIEEGHKTLVFSQFVTMLDLLREKFRGHGWPCFYLAGETENRGELVREFQSAMGGGVFLLSLRAGGFGLNLTAASYVVLFDPWWNPAVENQAIDRTHRIGQTSKVIAYRLLMRDSIEQKVRALQKRKAALVEDVLGEERFAQSLNLEDLRFLFADGVVSD
jgi:superfamily II DNA or RNA helicase